MNPNLLFPILFYSIVGITIVVLSYGIHKLKKNREKLNKFDSKEFINDSEEFLNFSPEKYERIEQSITNNKSFLRNKEKFEDEKNLSNQTPGKSEDESIKESKKELEKKNRQLIVLCILLIIILIATLSYIFFN